MEFYRIINFIIQSAYLIIHFLFIIALYRRRQATPVWFWFFGFCIASWVWVSGRFLETIVYLFFPTNNAFYQFAANYQYIGNTTAAAAYLLWVMYLSGRDRLASSGWFRTLVFACPVVTCGFVFTNPWHHLFYTKLDMGQRVAHGTLFLPCLLWSYLLLLAGYIISIRYVLGTDRDQLRQIIMFSLFPLLPAAALLIRFFSGIDRFDYTPIVMAVCVLSLYQIIFRRHYVNIVSFSIREVIEQTEHPIGIYDSSAGKWRYTNRIAANEYEDAMRQLLPKLPDAAGSLEGDFGGRHMIVDVMPLPGGASTLIAATDMSGVYREQSKLEGQIHALEALRLELDEARRNIDAYLESLPDREKTSQRQDLIETTHAMADDLFQRVEENLETARQNPAEAEGALRENLDLTRDGIAAIRSAVARLRGE